ncbi:hypothetical protein FQZ97_1009180 [compost metagenome]
MALGHDVGDAQHFEHGAHRAAGDDAGTLGSGQHHDVGGAVLAMHAVVQRTVLERHLDHVAAGLFHGLLHGHRHFTRLALAHAHAAIAVADNCQCCETEDATALDHLGHAVDRDHLLAQTVFVRFVLDVCRKFSHFVVSV